MTTVFGFSGAPVGSIDEHAFYGRDGSQFGENRGGYLYFTINNGLVQPGQFAGTVADGVIYNVAGIPQAFTKSAKKGCALAHPETLRISAGRVLARGFDVTEEAHEMIPSFLEETFVKMSAGTSGIFQ